MRCRIEIEVLENGYQVSVPDIEAVNKAEAAQKKARPGSPSCIYPGDYMKKYAAKSVKEVIALVTPALQNLPQSTYDAAFAEAAAKKSN